MRGELCQENPQFSQLSTNLIRHESIETSRIHLTKSTEEQRDTLRLLDLCEQIRRQVRKNTVLQLRAAGFEVILNLAACRGISPDTVAAALEEMRAHDVTIVENTEELKKLR